MSSIYCCLLEASSSGARADALAAVARACSPRVDPVWDRAVIFDAAGLERAVGPPEVVGRQVSRLAVAEGLTVRVAIAARMTAAWLLANASADLVVAVAKPPADSLADLSLEWLESLAELDSRPPAGPHGRGGSRPRSRDYRRVLSAAYAEGGAILRRWGLRTMGELARLNPADIHARLGPAGTRLHQAARGDDARPLGPADEPPAFLERVDLEWPIEGLEPLAFVLARPVAALSAALERADRGAAAVTTTCHLVTRERHTRVLHLPAPIDEAAVLRTLVLLDLETHPPPAAIDAIEMAIEPAPRRVLQRSLLDRAGGSPDQTATLVARLGALMGETRVGRPVVLDSHDDRDIAMAPWVVNETSGLRHRCEPRDTTVCGPVLRRFRLPMAARVTVSHGAPIRVLPSARGLAGGEVVDRAGPWRSSGRWWTGDEAAWDRDEWDLELTDGGVYRLVRDRRTGIWVIEGLLD